MNFSTQMRTVRRAVDAEALEVAFSAMLLAYPSEMTRLRIFEAGSIPRGKELVAAHPLGSFVPLFQLKSRELCFCGQVFRIARGKVGNNGISWQEAEEAYHAAAEARGLALSVRQLVWQYWERHPHRALLAVVRDHVPVA